MWNVTRREVAETMTEANSCRNRHCPKCQYRRQHLWLQKREDELLDASYFHVVFTLPHVLHPLFLANPELCFSLLFGAVTQTLKEVALRPKNLGARIGFLAVLHTWTQKLLYHPHIHCVVPGGGLQPHTMQWVDSPKKYFLPVRILSVVFRGKLLQALQNALEDGRINFDLRQAKTLLLKSARKKWVVYSKQPFAGPRQVLSYLARYTHRIAISNARIVSMEGGKVTFRYRDRADGNRQKLQTLSATQFLRRFLLHVLPRGLVRLRYYGFLAHSQKRHLLEQCRRALRERRHHPAPSSEANLHSHTTPASEPSPTPRTQWLCPKCQLGKMLLVARFSPEQIRWFLEGRSTLL